jgi:predicted phosphodiesterase
MHESTRRTFLASLGTVAASLTLRPECLRGADAATTDLTFVVVTDTHLGYQGQDKAEKLWAKTAAAIDKTLAETSGSFVLHLGDIVDGGREPYYPKYVDVRKTIRKPVYETLGNHDPAEMFKKYIRPELDTVVDHDRLRVLLVSNAHTDSHDGFLTAEQIAWMTARADEAAQQDKLLLFAMHVPVHDNKHPDRGWYVKPAAGQKEFYALVDKHKSRTLGIFHGHFHNGLRGWDDRAPVHEVCFPSALYNQDRALEKNKAPGYNVPEFRPGFTVVTIRADKLELSYRTLDGEAAEEVATKALPRLAGKR